jgi:hypothetical protein
VASSDSTVFGVELQLDPKNAIKGIKKWNVENLKAIKSARTQTKALEKDTKNYFNGVREAWAEAADATTELEANLKSLAKEEAEATEALEKHAQSLVELARAGKDANDAEVKSAKQAVTMQQQKLKELEGVESTLRSMHKKKIDIQFRTQMEELGKAGAELAKPITLALSKDLPGAFEEGGRLVGKGVEKSFDWAGHRIEKAGEKFAKWGERMKSIGATKKAEGKGGGASSAIGSMLSLVGPLIQKLGPMVGMIAQLGPMISMTAGALVAVVKLMIDAEATAKEFNKDLLASASTGEFLAKSGADADSAYQDLSDTVRDLRDAANNLQQNLAWGTTKKDHLAFNNVLTQEGVSINRMSQEFEDAKKAGREAGTAADFYTKNVAVAVGYSRVFGVALNDIGTMQTEMMKDMGMSFGQAQDQFKLMANQAADSGMAMNTFYGIMRNISADLALYNVRIGEAAVLLGKLGKVMSSKTAGKFMQWATTALKKMGGNERLKVSLLAEKKAPGVTRKVVQEDLKQHAEELAGQLANGNAEVEARLSKALKAGDQKEADQIIDSLQDEEKKGALREQLSRFSIKQKMAKKGTVWSNAQGAGETGAGGQLTMMKKALTSMTGKGFDKISDAIGTLNLDKVAELIGMSPEEVQQMAIFEDMLDKERKVMIENAKTADEKAKIANANDQELMGMMSKEQKAKLKPVEKKDPMMKLAEKQGTLTQGIMDKLQTLIDYLMNQLYGVMSDMYDLMVGWMGDSEAKNKNFYRKMIMNSGDKDMIKAWTDSKGDWKTLQKTILSGQVDASAAIHNTGTAISTLADLKKTIDKTSDPKENARLTAEYNAKLKGQIKGGVLTENTDSAIQHSAGGKAALEKAMKSLSPKKADAVKAAMEAGKPASEALVDAGVELEKVAAIMSTAFENMADDVKSEIMIKTGRATKERETAFDDDLKAQQAKQKELASMTPEQKAAAAQARPGTTAVQPNASGGNVIGVDKQGLAIVQPAKGEGIASVGKGETIMSADMMKAAGSLGIAPDKLNELMGMDASAPPGSPAKPGAPSSQDAWTKAITGSSEDTAQNSANTLTWEEKIHDALRKKGIKIDASGPHTPFGASTKSVEDQVLDAARKALFEYWLYQSFDKKKVLDAMKDGKFDPYKLGSSVVEAAKKEGGDIKDPSIPGFSVTKAPAHALGGVVTGVQNGLAQVVSPAPGEGLTSIGKGERIVPAGGGGGSGTLNINISGMVDRELEARIRAVVIEHERRKAAG